MGLKECSSYKFDGLLLGICKFFHLLINFCIFNCKKVHEDFEVLFCIFIQNLTYILVFEAVI